MALLMFIENSNRSRLEEKSRSYATSRGSKRLGEAGRSIALFEEDYRIK